METEKQEPQNKTLVVFSGGLDSTTALYWAKTQGGEVAAVSFNYGQKHSKELDYAKQTCKDIDVEHYILNIPIPSQNSCLVNHSKEVPAGHYAEKTMESTVVNNRNAIMFSLATALAIDIKANFILVGIHSGDHFIYPDCRPAFFRPFSQAMIAANEGRIAENFGIFAPFIEMDKNDIAELAILLNVPIEKTYSDYNGGEVQDATSGTSVERIEAISIGYQRVNTIKSPFVSHHKCDPTEYRDKEYALDLLTNKALEDRLFSVNNKINRTINKQRIYPGDTCSPDSALQDPSKRLY